ncbi:MAG: alkyl sulfatase dimerization domain-containing protein [Bradyrhizobium sp.]|uniref:MBL fold metallo-hydrolase n=2 Tax=Bradyrhizobium TaxID=374 RepID=A0ABS5G6H6_9BRAD|nr:MULTISPECIES: alkyl sulfatase dimerization domain-containing protein [Bradyrhizobium]MBR1136922.1 MBL fold metallo-hydrolase [Bradyrhizobium denitrificans]MDU1492527.1 alkyl sulfatase dimerization domain-containing protein [Bradyrhizobium sp.]MDU1542938.1 alkyl sulfatase dimerization domain-containing protein [Bradyrhizobium sp.]MDU1665976.1 alkyl sulfatase dimerization domain-containing protein [Bradyrhizobium sp.]MDU1688971.1 alkyl sulfatase dimerization domain-containing protein [Bradyrh
MLDALPFADTADFADAARGFLGTIEDAKVTTAQGRTVWSLAPYSFLDAEDAPPTVNPSLWRQAKLNMHHGLFEVVPGVYQVRGLDIANMTLIEGETGVIVVDTLTSIEGARAALELYYQHRGVRPVTAVMFTHTHTDHWGGARGVVDEDAVASGRVPLIAPNLFIEHAVSENIIAGPAMLRRAQYQFGPLLAKGAKGHVDCGLGKSMAAGSVALLRPTDLIMATGDTRTIDGLVFEFQMAPNSEAPAEMHFYVPRYRLLNLAENCTHNFHNLLPFRGADVRDALAWSKYLGEALQLWGGKAEAMCGQHHWPVWGAGRVDTVIREQRDLYKFAHDQTVRLMNHGLTASEIAETIALPKSLEGAWHARGYYGHIRHNVKAIYQKYLGWYDANPANLDPLPPVEAGRKYVEYMGGAASLLARAREDFARGEFRFVAQAVSHLVFAEPDNAAARALLADTLEQLGYAAESATWRNAYLFGAQELRHGMPDVPARPGMPRETLAALRTEQLWDVLGVRLNGPKAEGKHIVLNWTFTDTGERFVLTLQNCALTYAVGVQASTADAGFTLARSTLDDIIAKAVTFPDAVAAGKISFAGNPMRLAELMSLMDEFPRMFEIVAPKRTKVT